MKTQIIQLEVHDDLISVRDKMGWGQAARIVLVWPLQQNILTRRLDLLLLQRHSKALGAQLALVTSNPDAKYHARGLQIPIFKTLRQAQSAKWRTGRRRSRSNPQRRAPQPDLVAFREQIQKENIAWYQGVFARRGYYTLTLLVVLSLLTSLLPGSKITLEPLVQEQQLILTVFAGVHISSPSRTGQLPARPVSVVVEGRDTRQTTGTVVVPEKAAGGNVRFNNLTDKAVRIPAGTIVSTLESAKTKAIRFRTTRVVTAPAGAGSVISAPVMALNPGVSGNLPAKSLVAIEGALGLSVNAENPSPTSGGSSRQVPGPVPADYTILQNQLLGKLSLAALEEALGALPEGSLTISPTLSMKEILEETYQPTPPLASESAVPSHELILTLRAEYEVLTVSLDDIKAMSISALDASLPKNYRPSNDRVQIEQLTPPSAAGENLYSWQIRTKRLIHAHIEPELAAGLARSRTLPAAQELLFNALPLEVPPLIEMSPEWWPRLPLISERIQLIILTP
jgi:hypothetical protein